MVSVSQMQQRTGRREGGAFTLLDSVLSAGLRP